jgi:hypothetical protein
MYKTTLAPNASWYAPPKEKPPAKKKEKVVKPRRVSRMGKRFSLPKETDVKFEQWLQSIKPIKPRKIIIE